MQMLTFLSVEHRETGASLSKVEQHPFVQCAPANNLFFIFPKQKGELAEKTEREMTGKSEKVRQLSLNRLRQSLVHLSISSRAKDRCENLETIKE